MGSKLIFLTHHKCASSWLSALVGHCAQINGLSLFASHRGTDRPSTTHDISLLTNADYRLAGEGRFCRAAHVIRNPLNVAVSAYYSHLQTHPTGGWPQLQRQREVLRSCSRDEGILLTLAFLTQPEFYPSTAGPLSALSAWNYDDDRFVTIRMEDLTADPAGQLRNYLSKIPLAGIRLPDAAHFTFERFSGGRPAGSVEPNSHYRSGAADDWRHELPLPAVAYIRAHFRTLLEKYYPQCL